jgi:parallel beta-helix repeat protein
VLEVDRSTPPTLFWHGEGFRLERLPTGSRIIYPPEPVAALADPDEAIRHALLHPLGDSEPLPALLRPGMRLTIAFDDISLPLPPMRTPDVRQRVIERVLAKDCWGDGFCISGSSSITVCNATGDHNRRQGLTITSVDGMVVRNCTFKNTSGTLPEDGIDIEPNPGETVNNVLITGCTFTSNSGFGIEMGVPLSYAGKAWVTGVTVDGNTVTGSGVNTLSTSPRAGIEASDIPLGSVIKITNNISSSNGLGIMIRDNANGFVVTGNTCSQNSSDGIQVYSTSANAITGNTATNNGRYGIYSVDNPTITISGNTLSGNVVGP